MSELTKEKIYKKELIERGATGNNNLERIRSMSGGGNDKPFELLETKLLEPVKNPILIRIGDEIFILGGNISSYEVSSKIYAFNIYTKEIRFVSDNFPKISGASVIKLGESLFWLIGGNVNGVTSNKIYSWTYQPSALNNFFTEMSIVLPNNEPIVKSAKFGKDYYLFGSSKNIYKLEISREQGVYYPNNITISLLETIGSSYNYYISNGSYIADIEGMDYDLFRIGGGETYRYSSTPNRFRILDNDINSSFQSSYSYDISNITDRQIRWISEGDSYYCIISKDNNEPASYARCLFQNGGISQAQTIHTTQSDVVLPSELTLINTEIGVLSFGGANGNLYSDSIFLINLKNFQ